MSAMRSNTRGSPRSAGLTITERRNRDHALATPHRYSAESPRRSRVHAHCPRSMGARTKAARPRLLPPQLVSSPHRGLRGSASTCRRAVGRRIRGIGTGLFNGLIQIADQLGIKMIWGEATANSATFYEKILGAEVVFDQFHIQGETMAHC